MIFLILYKSFKNSSLVVMAIVVRCVLQSWLK